MRNMRQYWDLLVIGKYKGLGFVNATYNWVSTLTHGVALQETHAAESLVLLQHKKNACNVSIQCRIIATGQRLQLLITNMTIFSCHSQQQQQVFRHH